VIAEKDYEIEERDNKVDELEHKIKDNQKQYENNYQSQKDKYEDKIDRELSDRQKSESNLRGQIISLEGQIVEMVNMKNTLLGNHEDEKQLLNDRINELVYSIGDLQNLLKTQKDDNTNLKQNIADINIKHSDE
jgi:septal ring factor EnvC (AmiA/AmiB activator)